jgi:uncharacterized membrane protein
VRSKEAKGVRFALTTAGVVAVGLVAIAFGSLWASDTLELFARSPIGRALELFVPFLPIFLITSGAFLLIKSRE